GERAIADDTDKRHAIGCVCAWAEAIGARRPLVHRLASVVDELMMNALHDTPGACERSAMLRWGPDERVLPISVPHASAPLRRPARRARSERGKPRSQSAGAGLGLYLVIANVASLVFNVEAGKRTEVVCLFDRARAGRPAASSVRSLHVFHSAP